jgi:hypothetical protein
MTVQDGFAFALGVALFVVIAILVVVLVPAIWYGLMLLIDKEP